MVDNTPTQKLHCLKNFDLAEYRQVFSDLAVTLYQKLVLLIMHEIKPMIGSLLEIFLLHYFTTFLFQYSLSMYWIKTLILNSITMFVINSSCNVGA